MINVLPSSTRSFFLLFLSSMKQEQALHSKGTQSMKTVKSLSQKGALKAIEKERQSVVLLL